MVCIFELVDTSVKTVISGSPFLGSIVIYRGHFYIHKFEYVFYKIEMDHLRLRWISKKDNRSTTGPHMDRIHNWSFKAIMY